LTRQQHLVRNGAPASGREAIIAHLHTNHIRKTALETAPLIQKEGSPADIPSTAGTKLQIIFHYSKHFCIARLAEDNNLVE